MEQADYVLVLRSADNGFRENPLPWVLPFLLVFRPATPCNRYGARSTLSVTPSTMSLTFSLYVAM